MDEDKPLLLDLSTVCLFVCLSFFSIFEMDQLGEIRQQHWKERLLTDCHDCNKLHETNML